MAKTTQGDEMKTKKGIFFITNELVTWYFYECNQGKIFASGGKVSVLDQYSILKTNNKTNECISTNWPNEVTNKFLLDNQIKRERRRGKS